MEIDRNILFLIEKGIILPKRREIYYALSSMDGMMKEIGIVRRRSQR
jgi:hypothetical protein